MKNGLKKIIVLAAVSVLSVSVFTSCGTKTVTPDSTVTANTENENICTLSVKCDVLIDKKFNAPKELTAFIPDDGVIFYSDEAAFEEGESVFDLLKRCLTEEGILFEYESTPAYGSAYIEGINNIYEFDFGDGSGWMYKVNGEFPKTGCSKYILNDGDVVEWVYTCDFGNDIGGGDAVEE